MEKVFELEADCRRKDELNAILAGKNQQFRNKILWGNVRLDHLDIAIIREWIEDKMMKDLALDPPQEKPTTFSRKEVIELIDSLREDIDEISEEMMAGIDLSK